MQVFTAIAGLCLVPLAVVSVTDQEAMDVIQEIKGHQSMVDRLVKHVLRGPGRHQAYQRLAYLTDLSGHRFIGSPGLQRAIDYIRQSLESPGFDLVQLQPVQVRGWDRGEETARMVAPRTHPLKILGLGFSVATPPGGITADAIVVKSFDELKEKAAQGLTNGKIIVYNQPFTNYFEAVAYRTHGAAEAAQVGGVACLVRSLTDKSLNTPHTGMQLYNDSVPKIPAASLTVEDVEMLQRIQDRGETISLFIEMTGRSLPDSTSYNIIAQINGTTYPDQVVMFGGHIDSWDVGAGVMDDAGGSVISWQALQLIKDLNLRPKRTMRMVLWTSEEVDFGGANVYFESEKDNSDQISLVMESDYGTFTPYGINFTGSDLARAYMQEVVNLLKPAGLDFLGTDQTGPDIRKWVNEAGVPGASLAIDSSTYFHYHHTRADMLTLQDPDDLDLCTLVWCTTAYVVANLDTMLPRTGDRPNIPTTTPPPQGIPGVGPIPTAHAPSIIGGSFHYIAVFLILLQVVV